MNRLISNSEIQTFKRCKRKWWFSSYRKLSKLRPDVSKPREVGSLVHQALDSYYAGGMRDISSVRTTLQVEIAKQYEKYGEENEEEVQKIGELATIMVDGYIDWLEETGADAHITVIAPEQEIGVPIEIQSVYDNGVYLIGKIDVRVHNEETHAQQFFETKTVGNFKDVEKISHIHEQMYMYHLLEYLANLSEMRMDGGIINMIRRVKRTSRAKPPFYKRLPVWHNEEELKSFYFRTWGTIRDILLTEERLNNSENPAVVVYPSPDKKCTWDCDFFHVCPMMDDPNADGEAFIDSAYQTVNPLRRYTKLELL